MKLLIVDDETLIVQGLKHIIENMNTEWSDIELAASGMQALAKLRDKPCDLVIADINMPGMNGLEFIRHAKQEQLCRYFAILSGYSKFEYAQSAIDIGVIGYLLKPVDKKQLARLLQQCSEKLADERKQTALRIRETLFDNSVVSIPEIECDTVIVSDGQNAFQTLEGIADSLYSMNHAGLSVLLCNASKVPALLDSIPLHSHSGYASGMVQTALQLRALYVKAVRAMLYARCFLEKPYLSADACAALPIPSDDAFDAKMFSVTGKRVSVNQKIGFQIAYRRMTGELDIAVSSLENPYAQKMQDIIAEHFNEHLTLSDVSSRIGLSSDYAGKIYKEATDMSFHDALNRYRVMHIAEALLSDPEINIEQLALCCGFTHLRNFYRVFSRFLHMSPGEYKRMIQNEFMGKDQ